MTGPPKPALPKPTLWKRLRRWACRGIFFVTLFWGLYACFLLLGFIPINHDYRLPPKDNRVRLFIRSSDIHTDFVLPIDCADPLTDWRTRFPAEHFHAPLSAARYIAVGWGSRGFYVETPTWADLKVATLLQALFTPSESVLHVEYLGEVTPGPAIQEILVTREQYRELASFVESTIGETDKNGAAVLATEISYGDYDRFYLSRGRYHMFNTCNQWTGRGLARAGVPTGIWTPLVVHIRCWLPQE
jgi:uncharacterized protein (TIGR02117 family)